MPDWFTEVVTFLQPKTWERIGAKTLLTHHISFQNILNHNINSKGENNQTH